MESRGVQTRVGDESRRISKVNRDIERKAVHREKVQAEIEIEQGQSEVYILPEIVYPDKLENEVNQVASNRASEALFPDLHIQRSHQPLVPDVDLDLVRQFGELLAERRDEMVLESLPEASELAVELEKITAKLGELSATADGVFETMARLLGKSDEFQRLADEKQRQAQQDKGRSQAPPDEKKQERVQRKDQSKPHQRKQDKKRDKKRDRGMEL